MRPDPVADLIIVGGGLSGGLLAWRLHMCRPQARILLLEGGARLGGNHTWSFHDTDLTAAQRAWIAPIVAHRWGGTEVRFQGLARMFSGGYASVTSDRFDDVLRRNLGSAVWCGVRVSDVGPTRVRLEDGRELQAGAVVDARGPVPPAPGQVWAWQKFLGRELRLAQAHGLERPLLMDATVQQIDGFRFIYVLPFSTDRLLVEDTYYSDTPDLAEDAVRGRIDAWLREQGWQVVEMLREERGVLPIALAGKPAPTEVPRIGLAGLMCHPTTGYALPDAVRLADAIADLPMLGGADVQKAVRAYGEEAWRRQRFFRLLNRMLFRAAAPGERHRVLARFHRLPEGLVARFYAGALLPSDRLRLLAGKPPVPLLAAARAAFML